MLGPQILLASKLLYICIMSGFENYVNTLLKVCWHWSSTAAEYEDYLIWSVSPKIMTAYICRYCKVFVVC